jgi:hypothetical protein
MQSPAPLDPSFDLQGPLDVAAFPATLSARVVTPGARPRVHGYDVEGDLARHYGPTDLLLLSLTGELPSPEASAALGVALTFLAPVSVAHASVHGAVLARLCGAIGGSTLGVAAIGLAEQARVLLDEHVALLAWLSAPTGELPAQYRASNDEDRAAVGRLEQALMASRFVPPALAARPTRAAALLIVLFACGLTQRDQLEAAIVCARLPSAVAEALSVKVADFDQYPANLPRYRYQEQP